MDFKEALISHLQGGMVECNPANSGWMPFIEYFDHLLRIDDFCKDDFACAIEFRLAPRTVTVNGVEVPAPESVAPEEGTYYFVVALHLDDLFSEEVWCGDEEDGLWLSKGLVYFSKEYTIARAKAMLITS